MALTINSFSLVGRLVKSIEIRPNQNPNEKGILGGKAYFTLANVTHMTKQDDGSYKDDASFYSCSLQVGDVNGKYADYLKEFQKGEYVAVSGIEKSYESTGKDGKVYQNHLIDVSQFEAVNHVTLSGNLTRDAKKYASKLEGAKPNTGFCKFTIANTPYGRKQTLYQDCTLNLFNYEKFTEPKQGDRVVCEGFLVTQTSEYEGKKISRNILVINPSTCQIFRKEAKATTAETAEEAPAPKKTTAKFKAVVKKSAPVAEEPQSGEIIEDFEDDNIPF